MHQYLNITPLSGKSDWSVELVKYVCIMTSKPCKAAEPLYFLFQWLTFIRMRIWRPETQAHGKKIFFLLQRFKVQVLKSRRDQQKIGTSWRTNFVELWNRLFFCYFAFLEWSSFKYAAECVMTAAVSEEIVRAQSVTVHCPRPPTTHIIKLIKLKSIYPAS